MGLRSTIFGRVYAAPQTTGANTFIGGVASIISTKAALATKLGVLESDISDFSLIGSDVEARINVNYTIQFQAFYNNRTITYFKCTDFSCVNIGGQSFYGSSLRNIEVKATMLGNSFNNTDKLEEVLIPEIVQIFNNPFSNSALLEVSLPKLVNCSNNAFTNSYLQKVYLPNESLVLGSTTGDNGVFLNIKPGCNIYVHPNLQTANAGSPDGDLVYAVNNGAIVTYINNFTKPAAPSNLIIAVQYSTALQINLTQPVSVNNIYFYEVYVDGVLNSTHPFGSEINATGLTPLTTYSISTLAVDQYNNKSLLSSSVTATTNQQPIVPVRGLVSYYKMDDVATTLNDAFGTDHLTVNGLTLNSKGIINTSAEATGSSNRADTTTSTPITGSFSINLWIYRTKAQPIGNNVIADQGGYGANAGFGLWINNLGNIAWRINRNYNNYSTAANIPIYRWKMVTLTFDGTTIKVYINNELKVSAPITTLPSSTGLRRLFNRDNFVEALIGRLDEVSFHNVDINNSERLKYFNNGNGITL